MKNIKDLDFEVLGNGEIQNSPPGKFPKGLKLKNKTSPLSAPTQETAPDFIEESAAPSVSFPIANKLQISDILPQSLELSFIELRLKQKAAGGQGGKRLGDVMSCWKKARQMILDSNLPPSKWGSNDHVFQNIAVRQQISPWYYMKLRIMINQYGSYFAEETNTFYKPITARGAAARERLQEAFDSTDNSTKALPMTPHQIAEASVDKLQIVHKNFLFISLWLGLRPSELTALKGKPLQLESHQGFDVLVVYQKKLVQLKKELRFKRIPILEPEQVTALQLLKSGNYRAPILTTMRRVFGKGYGLYSGRQGFTQLMLGRGYPLESISKFLGHAKVTMTTGHYVGNDTIQLDAIKKAIQCRQTLG